MNKLTRDMLMDLIEKIDAVSAAMESLADYAHGPRLEGMYVEHEEIGKLEIDLDMMSNDLGNLRDYVEQHIKESYSAQ